jgi:hypothetical protein
LFVNADGELRLTVPADLSRGYFLAIDDLGVRAISPTSLLVCTAAEVDALGGSEKLTERGHRFHYQTSALAVEGSPRAKVNREWYLPVDSVGLVKLRRSYGLPDEPFGGFRIPIAERPTGVLGRNELSKTAAVPEPSYSLSGELYLSDSGWLLLDVPNALVQGVFAGLSEPGLELPNAVDGKPLKAHISVMSADEVRQLGGGDKITERGKRFRYSLGRLSTVEPGGWSEVERVWMLVCHSPELQQLRRSYGLSGIPHDGEYQFHITCAIRRRDVLSPSPEARKGAADVLAAPTA